MLGGTRLADAIMARFMAGAVVAGTSAGACAVSSHMIAFGASGATPKHRMAQIAAGLGLLPGVIVDQHFQQRNRLGRLLSLIAQNPSLLGLGVDEDTAGVVGPDQVMEVIGRGSITVVDGAASETDAWEIRGHSPLMISGVVLHRLPAGYRVRPPAPDAASRRRTSRGHRGRRSPRATRPRPGRALQRVHSRLPRTPRRQPVAQGGSRGSRENGRRRDRRRRTPDAAAVRTPRPGEPSRARLPRRRRRAPSPPSGSSRPAILRGPNYWAQEPVIRQVVDLGVLEEFPSNRIPGLRGRPRRDAADPRGPRLLASAAAAGSSRGSARGPGPATSPSTSRSSSRTSPAPTSATARPAAPASTAATT